MKIRFLFTILLSVAVVAGAVITFDAFAANFREDPQKAESLKQEDTAFDTQEQFVCEAKGCARTGVHEHMLCSLPDCTEVSVHVHDGSCYYAHSADDGHAYHVCGVDGCTLAGEHTHNSCGISGCTLAEEHAHNSCGVDGCTLADEHTHNSCGISGCAQTGEHTHNSCGVNGCNIMDSHSHHNGNSGGSGHHSRQRGHH